MTYFIFFVALILIITGFEIAAVPAAILGFFFGGIAYFLSGIFTRYFKEEEYHAQTVS